MGQAIPAYVHHRPTGQARVRINGRDLYLGRHGTPASREAYDRAIAQWLAGGRCHAPTKDGTPADLTVADLVAGFWTHCERYYGPGSELDCIRAAMRPLVALYGSSAARDFGPLDLKALQAHMVEAGRAPRRRKLPDPGRAGEPEESKPASAPPQAAPAAPRGLTRGTINRQVARIKRLFKWATENGHVPPDVFHGLQAVSGLRRGRSAALEPDPVRPVPDSQVDAATKFMTSPVAAMVAVQRLTGMRPGEVVAMRACDLEMTGRIA